MKTVLVAGATGNTGRPLVEQLLAMGHTVRVIVRSRQRLPAALLEHSNLTIVEASILDLTDAQMGEYAMGCDAVVHASGMSSAERYLWRSQAITEATRRLCGD